METGLYLDEAPACERVVQRPGEEAIGRGDQTDTPDNNSTEEFANSPDLTSEILAAVMESMDAQSELSTRALNSGEIRDGLKSLLLERLDLYEKLRARASDA